MYIHITLQNIHNGKLRYSYDHHFILPNSPFFFPSSLDRRKLPSLDEELRDNCDMPRSETLSDILVVMLDKDGPLDICRGCCPGGGASGGGGTARTQYRWSRILRDVSDDQHCESSGKAVQHRRTHIWYGVGCPGGLLNLGASGLMTGPPGGFPATPPRPTDLRSFK